MVSRRVPTHKIKKKEPPVKYTVRVCTVCGQKLDPDCYGSWETDYVQMQHKLQSDCISYLQSEVSSLKDDVKSLEKRMDKLSQI